MCMEIVRFKKLNPKAIIPTQGSTYAAGYDLYACIDEPVFISSHETIKIGTGLAIQPPTGYFGGIFARSGLATKEGLRPANAVGVCDEDYTGEYIVALYNDSDSTKRIDPNQRIAQLIFIPCASAIWKEVNELDFTNRQSGGFGSTGN